MVEKNAVVDVYSIDRALVQRNPVRIELRHDIRAARIEWSSFLLLNFLHKTVKFTVAGLVKSGFLLESERTNCVNQSERTKSIDK